MSNLNVVVRLENVMMNGFNVEENYEKGLKRRVGLTKELSEGVKDINVELKELYDEVKGINSEIEGYKKLVNILKKEGKKEEMDVWKEKLGKIEDEKKELNDKIKGLRKERGEIEKGIIEEMNKKMDELRKRDKDVIIKRMKEDYDRDFEKNKLRKGVDRVFERLLKIKRVNEGMRLIVVSEVRCLKVRRLLNNLELTECEVVNSNVENWKQDLEKEGDNTIFVEEKEELENLIERVKLYLKSRKLGD